MCSFGQRDQIVWKERKKKTRKSFNECEKLSIADKGNQEEEKKKYRII